MKDLNYYLSLKYPIELVETDEGFVATHLDLPGCASFGDTAAEAVESLNEVRKLWLQGQVEANGSAPEPRPEEEFSGRFVVRLPKWLHRMLDAEAKRQDCSLNTYVVSVLSFARNLSLKQSESPNICKVEAEKTWMEGWADEPEAWSGASWYIDAGSWLPPSGDVAQHFKFFTHKAGSQKAYRRHKL